MDSRTIAEMRALGLLETSELSFLKDRSTWQTGYFGSTSSPEGENAGIAKTLAVETSGSLTKRADHGRDRLFAAAMPTTARVVYGDTDSLLCVSPSSDEFREESRITQSHRSEQVQSRIKTQLFFEKPKGKGAAVIRDKHTKSLPAPSAEQKRRDDAAEAYDKLVASAKPSVVVVGPMLPDACAACGGPARQMCAKCSRTRYCSRECQRGDWPRHREECGAVARR